MALAWPGAQGHAAAPGERAEAAEGASEASERSEPKAGSSTEGASEVTERSEPRAAEGPATADVLRVHVAPALDDAALLPRWITERHPGLAEVVRDPEGRHAQWIAVEISGTTYDFRVSVTAVRDGEPLTASTEPTRCECTTEELLARVDVGIEAAIAQLRTTAPAPAPAPSEVEPGAAPGRAVIEAPPARSRIRATVLEPRPLDVRSRRLGPLGHAGIGASAAGVGLLTAGVVLVRRPEQIRGAPGRVETRDFRRGGVGLAAAGGLVLATGVALLVVDLVTPRRGATAVVPMTGPGTAGASIVRRF